MDDAKHVRWLIMSFSFYLQQLHKDTIELSNSVDRLLQNLGVENDHEEELDHILKIMEKRNEVIGQYNDQMKSAQPAWSAEDKRLLSELKDMQTAIQPKLKTIFADFQAQLYRFQQGKKVAQGYYNQSVYTDGTFIDKKK